MKTSPIEAALEEAHWLTTTLPIRLFGDPILTKPCEPVTATEIDSGKVEDWVNQLIDFLKAFRTKTGMGRGLAANQIGISKQMALVWLDTDPEIYINPEVTSYEGKGVYPESCISSASLILGNVIRPWKATFLYTTRSGEPKTIAPDQIHTRILLHELDHLDGRVCSDLYEPGTISLATGNADQILKPELKRLT
jgi:peptide deformylase